MYKLPSILLIALSFAITTDEVYDNSWALIVGINNYENVQDLNYAVEDALAIKNLLINNYHFPRSNVRVLTDSEATQGKIKKELSNLVKYAGKKDRIIFFFAGHGDTEALGIEEGEMGFFIPYDGDLEDVNQIAKEIFNPTNFIIAVVGNKDSSATFLNNFDNIEYFSYKDKLE